jgi:hypothetical protein
MSKHLLIPVFLLAVAATGCSGGGTHGGTGGAGTAGATAGAGGGAGWDAGAGGTTGATCEDAGMQPPPCGVDAMSPSMFCTVLLSFCCPTAAGYTTMDACMTTYTGLGTTNPFKQTCESQHLCNAANDTGDERTLHCGHAVGEGLCNF